MRVAPTRLLILAALLCASTTFAESTISMATNANFAWAWNAGWVDFRPSDADGVKVSETFLSGYAYAPNFGWIHLGNGTPANGYKYSNASATDYGVNVSARGDLSGYAYAPNVGWIVFDSVQGSPRIDFTTGNFGGFAYGANIGWISLHSSTNVMVQTASLAITDSDGDGISDAWEMEHFGNLTAANATTDADHDGISDLQEYIGVTDPKDSSSQFRIVSHSVNTTNSTATVQFTSSPNRNYRIEYQDKLTGSWTNSTETFNPDWLPTTMRTFTFPTGSQRLFFRIVAKRPLQP